MESAQSRWERGVAAATLFLVASSALAVVWHQRHQIFHLARVEAEARPAGESTAGGRTARGNPAGEGPVSEGTARRSAAGEGSISEDTAGGSAAGGAAAGPGTPPGPAASAALPRPTSAQRVKPGPVDVNRAGVEELTALPGIGPVLARRVVEQRQKRGWYKKVEDLLEVPGIGPKVLEKIRPWVRLGEQVATRAAVPSAAAGGGAPAP